MGNCCTVPFPPPDEVPRCDKCGVSGNRPWGQLGQAQRKSYWVIKGDVLECKGCNSKVGQRLGSRSAEQERVLLAMQKEERYPRQAKQPTLRTIDSGTQWDNSASFYDGLRRVSALGPRRSVGPHYGAGPSEGRIDPAQRLEQIQHELVGGPSMVVVEEDIDGEEELEGESDEEVLGVGGGGAKESQDGHL